jgi:hypothetical protein
VSWAKIDDRLHSHPKVLEAGPEAMGLFLLALSWCADYLTDGFVPEIQVRRLLFVCDDPLAIADKLVGAELWERADGGYQIHDYLEYNPSAEQVKAERAANAKRQAEWRDRKRQGQGGTMTIRNSDSNSDSNGVTNNSPVPVPVPVPVPKPKDSAPSAAETPELTGEAALDAAFGERPPQVPTKARMPPPTDCPWRDWSGGAFRERDGVSVNAQDRVSWLVEDITGLAAPGNYTGWGNGAIACYIAGRGDWATIEAGIRNAWGREPQFRPSTLACTKRNADQNGFVKAIGKARAEVDKPPERAYSPLDAIPIVRAT